MYRARILIAILSFAVILPLTATSQTKTAPDVPLSPRGTQLKLPTVAPSPTSTARTAPDVPLSSRIALPKPVPIAESKLLMEAIAEPNLRRLEKLLSEKPPTPEAWKFARGQALLIGETGNLLMVRPPRTQGQIDWLKLAAELRDSASNVAKQISAEDYAGSRSALVNLAGTCNKCHETFRVAAKIAVFQEAKK